MISNFLSRVNTSLNKIEQIFINFIFKQPPPPGLCFNIVDMPCKIQEQKQSVLENIFGGFLWAVPKHRRTIERRLKRKYGSPQYVMKQLLPKPHLVSCHACGNFYEKGVLCGHCYKKVIQETEEIQEVILKDMETKPIDKEVIVLYEGENVEKEDEEMFKGKRIVEVPKKRPEWFCKNLLQKSTTPSSNTTDIKPSDLG